MPEEQDDLELISAWLDEHGWDSIQSPEFDKWLTESGIDKSTLTIHCCRMPDHA